jgi:1,2-diacylglycerol 3-alpha-glucosyltransferase
MRAPGIAQDAHRNDGHPLHILMVSDVYFPRINGVSTSIQTFRAELERLGIRVTVVAPSYPAVDIATDGPTDTIRMPSRAVPLDPEDRLMRWQALADLDRRLAGVDIDLVHVQTPFAAHYAGLRLARSRGIPCIATYHTHFEEYLFHYIRFLPKAALRAAARALARHQCNALDAVVVPSQPMASHLA